jgi:hypothetical protein
MDAPSSTSSEAETVKLVKLEFRADTPGSHTLRPYEEALHLHLKIKIGRYGRFLVDRAHHVPEKGTAPVRPTGVNAVDDIDWEVTVDNYKKAAKEDFVAQRRWKTTGMGQAYTMMENWCSKEVWDNVKLITAASTPAGVTFAELDSGQDPLILSEVLRTVARNGPAGKLLSTTSDDIKERFDLLQMGTDSLAAFQTKYDDYYELAIQAKSFPAMSDAAHGRQFIRKLDPIRFLALQLSFKESEFNGRDDTPKSLLLAKLLAAQHLQLTASSSLKANSSPVFTVTPEGTHLGYWDPDTKAMAFVANPAQKERRRKSLWHPKRLTLKLLIAQ